MIADEQPLVSTPWCAFCGGIHEDVNIICNHCGLCARSCQRDSKCKWKRESDANVTFVTPPAPNLELAVAPHGATTGNLQEAFECWLASSNNVTVNADGETLWQEFETFAKELLTPVDGKKMYMKVTLGEKPELNLLNTENLFTNQDGEYVVVEGKKRVRIGKTVAVMGL